MQKICIREALFPAPTLPQQQNILQVNLLFKPILISLHNCDEFNQMTYLKAGDLLLFSVGATVTTCKNQPS